MQRFLEIYCALDCLYLWYFYDYYRYHPHIPYRCLRLQYPVHPFRYWNHQNVLRYWKTRILEPLMPWLPYLSRMMELGQNRISGSE